MVVKKHINYYSIKPAYLWHFVFILICQIFSLENQFSFINCPVSQGFPLLSMAKKIN